jgi:hypothetical protein
MSRDYAYFHFLPVVLAPFSLPLSLSRDTIQVLSLWYLYPVLTQVSQGYHPKCQTHQTFLNSRCAPEGAVNTYASSSNVEDEGNPASMLEFHKGFNAPYSGQRSGRGPCRHS